VQAVVSLVKSMFKPLTVLLSLGLSLASCFAFQPWGQAQPHRFFGADPATIERRLGPYWSRLTAGSNVTYTYNPAKIDQLFPGSKADELLVVFTDDRATSVSVWMSVGLTEFSDNGYPLEFDALFKLFFGYDPSPESSVYGKSIHEDWFHLGGTLHMVWYCVEDGVALSYEYASNREYAIYVGFQPDEACKASE